MKPHSPKDLLFRFVIGAAGATGLLYLLASLFG